MMTRRRALAKLGEDLVLNINPRKVTDFADPPRDHLHMATKRLHKHWWGLPFSLVVRSPYEIFVQGGDWDTRTIPFTEHKTYLKMLDLYQHRQNIRESKLYARAMNRLQERGNFRHKNHQARSQGELDQLFQEVYLELLRSMEEEGYLRERSDDLCRVMISRDGRLIKTQRGKHRFSTAHIVGAPVVPVVVFRIHREWMQARSASFRGKGLELLRQGLREVEARYRS